MYSMRERGGEKERERGERGRREREGKERGGEREKSHFHDFNISIFLYSSFPLYAFILYNLRFKNGFYFWYDFMFNIFRDCSLTPSGDGRMALPFCAVVCGFESRFNHGCL